MGVAIIGFVTDISGNGIPGVYVQVYDQNDRTIVLATITTNSTGAFTIPLAPSSYKVGFFPGPDDGNYLPQWYNNKSDFQSADAVTVKRFKKSAINVFFESP
jgi:hypothetical protein